MDRTQLTELHCISHIDNIASILKVGILSHNRAKRLPHISIAMQKIQDRRSRVAVPGGLKLHDYANLYFTARNPMLYKRRAMHESLLVVRVSTDVLDLPGVVITDGNAARDYPAFLPSPSGLESLSYDLVFARYWKDPDQLIYWRKKSCKCSEVLVPESVPPTFILGAHVSCQSAAQRATSLAPSLAVHVSPDLFFL